MFGGEPMDLELLFKLANAGALVGWIALVLAPLRRPALLVVARLVGTLLAVGYVAILATSAGSAGGLAADYSLAGIGAFFDDPRLRLLGWVHYLAFDLWVGAWEAEDAGRSGVPHALLLPALALTFLLGPVGLLLYLGVRAASARRAA